MSDQTLIAKVEAVIAENQPLDALGEVIAETCRLMAIKITESTNQALIYDTLPNSLHALKTCKKDAGVRPGQYA